MNDDVAAAIALAAQLLFARANRAADASPPPPPRWNRVGRLAYRNAQQLRFLGHTHSGWALSGRLRD